MKSMTLEEFRGQVQSRRGARRRGAPRYPDELVAFAVAHARAALSSGRRLGAAAAELGLSAMTLGAWVSRGTDDKSTRLREVVVQPTAAEPITARTVEVKTASGHIVRGLSVSEATVLLKALA